MYEVARYLHKKGQFEIVVGAGGSGELLKELETIGIRTRRFHSVVQTPLTLRDLHGFFEIKEFLQLEQPDIVFLNSTKVGFWGALACRFLKSRPKVIYRIGGFAFTEDVNWAKQWLYFLLEKISASWKDVIIVNSQHNFDLALQRRIAPASKLKLIRNGVDVSRMQFLARKEARGEFLRMAGIAVDEDLFVVGTVANFYANKGIEYLIECAALVAKTHPETLFVIIGDGPLRSLIEEKVEALRVSSNVKLLGAIPEARKYFKEFDLFVLSSVKEGFPWTLLEAAAAGVPIVATAVGGVPEFVENERTGLLVEAKNPGKLAEAIKKLIENSDMRKRVTREALSRLEQEYSLQTVLQKSEQVVREVQQ